MRGRKLRREEERSIELKRGRERSLEGSDCEMCCLCFFVKPPFLVTTQLHEVRRESVVPSAHHFYLD